MGQLCVASYAFELCVLLSYVLNKSLLCLEFSNFLHFMLDIFVCLFMFCRKFAEEPFGKELKSLITILEERKKGEIEDFYYLGLSLPL